MTWLVLSSGDDPVAGWIASHLEHLGLHPVVHLTAFDLVGATWRHEIAPATTSTRLDLADGSVFDSGSVQGVVNRLAWLPMSLVVHLAPADRPYARQEMSALVLSWLASLACPVLNPATPRGLAGAFRPAAEWALLAIEAGLDAAPLRVDSASPAGMEAGWLTWTPQAPFAETAIVIGDVVFAESTLAAPIQRACCALARLSGTPLLGLAFDSGRLVGATPLPDLRDGGTDLVEALAATLGAA